VIFFLKGLQFLDTFTDTVSWLTRC